MIVVYFDNKDFHTDVIPRICEPRPAAPAEPSEQDEQTETETEQEQHRPGRRRKDV